MIFVNLLSIVPNKTSMMTRSGAELTASRAQRQMEVAIPEPEELADLSEEVAAEELGLSPEAFDGLMRMVYGLPDDAPVELAAEQLGLTSEAALRLVAALATVDPQTMRLERTASSIGRIWVYDPSGEAYLSARS